jgi:HAD superfamily phosphatase (TIGR01668 family)
MFKILSAFMAPFQLILRETYPTHRKLLPKRVSTLASVELERLKLAAIRGIILDLDNTVVSEDDRYLSPHAERWIGQAKSQGLKFYILSNGKRPYRVRYWSKRLEIPAINPAHKPNPINFHKALKRMQLKTHQAVVIGDSIHTDIIGAWLSGCYYIQVSSLPHPPRWWEKLFGKWVQIPYPAEQELWELEQFHE